jgi:hypothetical protein
VGHDGRRLAAAVAYGARTCRRSPLQYVPTAVGYGGMSVARYGPTSGGPYRCAPRRYVPATVAHDGRCIVLQDFWRAIYFLKIEIEKIYKKIWHNLTLFAIFNNFTSF